MIRIALALSIFGAIFISGFSYASEQYETVCKQYDCFRYGWVTTGPGYVLDTKCKRDDCARYGWHSAANDKSTYDVSCHQAGCFIDGWDSVQWGVAKALDLPLLDRVTCKAGGCLKGGWSVLTGYDPMGGDVSCYNEDCSTNGGYSRWRGRNSHTACYNHDCYKFGWTLYIE